MYLMLKNNLFIVCLLSIFISRKFSVVMRLLHESADTYLSLTESKPCGILIRERLYKRERSNSDDYNRRNPDV